MPLIRIFILGVIIWLLYRLVRRLLASKPEITDQKGSTHMVRCQQCGVYITKDEAYEKDKAVYCSKDHYTKHREESDG